MRSLWSTIFTISGSSVFRKVGDVLPNNQRQRRTCASCHILYHALCHILYPVPAAHTVILGGGSLEVRLEYHLDDLWIKRVHLVRGFRV